MDDPSLLQKLEGELEILTSQFDKLAPGEATSEQRKQLKRRVSAIKSAAVWGRRWTHRRLTYIGAIGVLAWGLPMFLVMNFVVYGEPSARLGVSAILWGVGGVAFGWFTWASAEKRYRRVLGTSGINNDRTP